jgi:Arginyl-tRNA synthetase
MEIQKLGNNQNVNIEFVSANPTGPIHVAHMRGAVFGDVLASIFNKTGYNITREYYVNDSGTQIDILSKSLYKRYCQIFNMNVSINNDEYPGDYLKKIAKKISVTDSDKWLKIEESKRHKFFKDYAVRELVNQIRNDLQLLNINFDIFTYESNIQKQNIIDELFVILNEKKLLYEGILDKPKTEDNSEWEPRKQLLFKSTNLFDDRDRPLKKANGEWTYFANDAAYHYDKYKRKFDIIINVWGADHIGYVPRMKSIVSSITNKDNYFRNTNMSNC